MFMHLWIEWLQFTFKALQGKGRRSKRSSQTLRLCVESLEDRVVPTTINLGTIADNTLYQDSSGQLSNGAGQHFFVGDTAQSSNYIRRGAIKFDLSAVPTGATITSVTLTLHESRARNGAQTIVLHRALKNWGEGTSDAALGGTGPGEGDGVQATTNDVTWLYTFYNSQSWNTPGGDFVASASASTAVNNVGSYQWTGPGLIADVQQWVNNPATDDGWIVTGNETAQATAKQFDTKENADPTSRPVLTVVYTPPVPDLTIAKSHVGIFHPGDSADTYSITVSNVGAAPTDGSTVTVIDTLPTGLLPTAADNTTTNGWTVTASGQTVTAVRSDVLGMSAAYPVLTVTVSVADNISRSVINTATVAGGGEVNTANDSATDPTATTPVADLTISKRHIGLFHQGDAADLYTLTVKNISTGPTLGSVTVTDTLPTGLAPTAADNGIINGWTVSFQGRIITATRNDTLAGGDSYPILTLTVSVADNAPVQVTNHVSVSGGGEINVSNDTAFDVATVLHHTPIRRRRGA
jgi:hypothetical protein